MDVCRMRQTPVIVFVNKLDRPARIPSTCWTKSRRNSASGYVPSHSRFRAATPSRAFTTSTRRTLYALYERRTADGRRFDRRDQRPASPELDEYISERYAKQLREDTELVEGVYDAFDRDAYLWAELAPGFFFGSAVNFGVKELLECFIRIAPSPDAPCADRNPDRGACRGENDRFVFKIHANMDPNHRDRIAFLKICSGTFERNKNFLHVRSGKNMKFASPTAFMAEKSRSSTSPTRATSSACTTRGNFKIGDTFTEGEKLKFTGIPPSHPNSSVISRMPIR